MDAGVGEPLLPRDQLQERAGDEVDAQFARDLARPGDRGPVEGFGGGAKLLVAADGSPLLGQDDQLRSIHGGGACETIDGSEVRVEVGGGVELDGGCLHLYIPLRWSSINLRKID